ncbi:HNH endonuclease [Pseudomonas rhizoryzae]|uniref:HNH endonuclease n=1 Tax=Pseudomonas rhizoryzae TaxID=2571129 RepID=UPI000ADA9B98|nr:HNH endonuclease [Pseudomonas rhizoryzae]
MTSFEYTLEEYFEIVRALGGKTNKKPKIRPTPQQSWGWPNFSPIKRRLKEHLLAEQYNTCCYCQRNLSGEFRMILDVEHILPKHVFCHCIFDLPNLAVSCRRCNFHVKGKKVDFFDKRILLFPKILKSELFKKEYYDFVHPNLDDRFAHLCIEVSQKGPKVIVRYEILSPLGQKTYDYFRLNQLEINSWDDAAELLDPETADYYDAIKQLEDEIYR